MSPVITTQDVGNFLVVCLVLMMLAVVAAIVREGWDVIRDRLDDAAAELPSEDERRDLAWLQELRDPDAPIANELVDDWPAIECRARFGSLLCRRHIGHGGEHNDGAMHWTGDGLRLVDPFDAAEDAAWDRTMNDRPGGGAA